MKIKKPKIIIYAHKVTIPIEDHHAEEFRNRIIFLSKFYEIYIISLNSKSRSFNEFNTWIKLTNSIFIKFIRSGVFFSFLRSLKSILEIKPSFIIADSTSDARHAIFPAILFKSKLVTYYRGFEFDIRSSYYTGLKKILKPLLFIVVFIWNFFIFKISFSIGCSSNSLVENIKNNYGRNIRVEYIPKSLRYVAEALKEKDYYQREFSEYFNFIKNNLSLSFVGHLDDNKRPWIAINTLKSLIDKGIDASLLIFGVGPQKDEMISQSIALGIKNNVKFVGHASRELLINLLSEINFLLAPSLSEGLSNAIAEAMCVKCAVITYASKGGIEISGNGNKAILVNNEKLGDYSEYILHHNNPNYIKDAYSYFSHYMKWSAETRFQFMRDKLFPIS